MEVLYVLLVLLVLARALGEVAERVGQPPLVGELLAGVGLGIAITRFGGSLPVLSGLADDDVFVALTDLGIFFLMLLAGLEMRPRDLARTSRGAFLVACGGLLLPLALGFGTAWWALPSSDVRFAQALFVGVALAITAVPVSVKVLMDLGQLESRVGRTIVSAALFDDVLSLVLLAVLTAVIRQGSLPDASSLAALGLAVAAFFAVAVLAGHHLFPRLGRLVARLHGAEFEFSFLLIAALAYAVLAELLEMHFIIGAFMAGLFFGRSTIDAGTYDDVLRKVKALSSGFLAPIFFASIGLHLDAAALTTAPLLFVALLVAASLGKIVGAGAPARALGLSRREAMAVGVGMNARGAVELIVADVALRAGLLSRPTPTPEIVEALYSAIVLLAVLTTLATPIGLRRLFARA